MSLPQMPTLPRQLLAICLGLAATAAAGEAVVVRASQTVTPLIEVGRQLIAAAHPDAAFKVTPCGTKASIDAVAGGTAQLGATVRALKDDEKAANPDLVLTAVAKDGVALVVNAANPVADLSAAQVTGILTGTIANWKELGGPDQAIAPVGRTEANNIVEFVDSVIGLEHQVVGEGRDQGMAYRAKGAAAFAALKVPVTGKHIDAIAQVAKNPGGFTFAPLGMAREAKAKGSAIAIVAFAGKEANDANIAAGAYPFSRTLYLLTKGAPQGVVKDLADALLSPEGQKQVSEHGCIAIR